MLTYQVVLFMYNLYLDYLLEQHIPNTLLAEQSGMSVNQMQT